MNEKSDLPYWFTIAHLPQWKTERLNLLILDILFNKKLSWSEFFSLKKEKLKKDFQLNSKEISDILKANKSLPNASFIIEELISQGVKLVPIYSPEYPRTLKNNLELKYAPPLLYTKGDIDIFKHEKVAIVGSRNASEKSIKFTEMVAERYALEQKVVVSGYAKGVDRTALEATLNHNGLSIIVLPQGIQTFTSGMKKLYRPIVNGKVLIISTYPPKAGWSVGLAMGRNIYIYGLSDEIYVAESGFKGGTWNGVRDGLKKGRRIFIRETGPEERCANNELIRIGGIPVDTLGQVLEVEKEVVRGDMSKSKQVTLLDIQ